MNCFIILTTSAFVFRTGKPRGKTTGRSERYQLYRKERDLLKSAKKRSKTGILDRYQEDERYRHNLQSEGITKEKVEEWDRLASGPKRESTSQLKLNMNIGKHALPEPGNIPKHLRSRTRKLRRNFARPKA